MDEFSGSLRVGNPIFLPLGTERLHGRSWLASEKYLSVLGASRKAPERDPRTVGLYGRRW